ncbi:MAG: hypothetical protein NTY68_04315 [Candidatus Micrarchaeota archaeon]|nr:hypothetical protein [Candidatus Micrarchaeota archaeon]
MIVGDRINRIEADVSATANYEGFKIDIKMGDVRKEADDRLLISYIYTVDYGTVGKVSLYGVVVEGDAKAIPNLVETWTKTKRLPPDYMEQLINVINFLGSAHGTIVARVLNVRPPIIAPKLAVKQADAEATKKAAKK